MNTQTQEAALDVKNFHRRRKFADLSVGRIAYAEQGEGPAIVFVHGVPLNGFHWRHIMAGLSDIRRCIAPNLMGLGYSEISTSQEVSFTAQADMLLQFLDALGLDKIDLVGNDSGGAISQIFAAKHPNRLRTLTLTNCDVHDGWPPYAVLPMIKAARQGKLADAYRDRLNDPNIRRKGFSRGFADPDVLTDEVIKIYLEPILSSEDRIFNFHRFWMGFDCAQTVAIEAGLRALRVPTLIVWGLDDLFFELKWAYWLKKTIPGAVEIVEVPDAKLFFPEDRPAALIEPLRRFLRLTPA